MLVNISQQEVKVEFDNNLYISMSTEVYQELLCYVKHYETEVSGCGLVERIEHKCEDDKIEYEFRIKEVYLPDEQENTGASTDIKPNMIHKLMTMLIGDNKDVSTLKLHWHSHADIGVFHSGTDEDNYETLNNKDYLVSLVLNRQGQILGSVHLYQPLALDVTGVPVFVDVPIQESVTDKTKKSIEALDKYTEENKRVYVSSGYGGHWDAQKQVWVDDKKEETPKEKKWKKGKRREIRKELGLTDEKAKQFDECDTSACVHCQDEPLCSEYMYAMMDVEESTKEDTYDTMMRNRHGYGYGCD